MCVYKLLKVEGTSFVASSLLWQTVLSSYDVRRYYVDDPWKRNEASALALILAIIEKLDAISLHQRNHFTA